MVFARYIAFILSTYLGKFIKGLNKNSVNFSLLRGSFELKNVELAPDVLTCSDYLQLESGTIGSLSVNIPWHSLYSKRCEVVLRDVLIVVAPKYGQKTDTTAFFKTEEEFLAAVQAVLADESKEDKPEKESKHGFLHRLTQTILKNLAFRLENVSFQLEDKSGFWQGCSAAVKAHIGSLACEATDTNFDPVFIRPEDQKTSAMSIYRRITYENVAVSLLYAATVQDQRENATGALQDENVTNNNLTPSINFTRFDEALSSSRGVLTVMCENIQGIDDAQPVLGATLVVSEGGACWNPQCITTLGILSESVRFAPQRAYAWNARPSRRPRHADSANAVEWWQYLVQKVVECQKASRERSRFSWKRFTQRRLFISDFLYYCLLLLKAPWLPQSAEADVDAEQLARTPVHDVMACWNAARWLLKQYEKTGQAPQGRFYSQYLRYYCLHANSASEKESSPLSKLALGTMNINFTVDCNSLTAKLDGNLRAKLSRLLVAASKKDDTMLAQLSVASVAVVAENAEENPLFSINDEEEALLLTISQSNTVLAGGRLAVGSISTCLDYSFQELLFAKLTSYIRAFKPFMHQRFSRPANLQQKKFSGPSKAQELFAEQAFSQFIVGIKSIAACADGVCLRIQNVGLALAPHEPVVIRIQEVAATVNDESLLQLCCTAVTPVTDQGDVSVAVVTDSASLSTNVEIFEYVKLLMGSTAQRWYREASNAVVETESFYRPAETAVLAEFDTSRGSSVSDKSSVSNKSPMKVSVYFGFIECGALALDAFAIQATLSDGWHIHLSAAGATSEGWCHSAPPHPEDSFMNIDVWADACLQESPFAGNIEDNGIGFVFTLNHVTLCLGDGLAATAESLFDTMMLLIFDDEDRHVHLRNDHLFATPHISGRLVGSNVRLLLESDGGDITLLPGYAAAMKSEASRDAFVIPVPPMPLTVELLGEECLDVNIDRYGDKRMDIAVVLQGGVNAFLRGTPAHVPLIPSRAGTRAEIELHLSAPSEADLPVFPYSRVDIAMKLSEVAVVAHIPTIMALWNNFNTPSLPLGRIRNVGNRVHFISRPSRPGKTLAPRSPVSTAVEAVGAAALARSSPFAATATSGTETNGVAPQSEPSPIYTTPVFPSDVTLRVELVRSELYYLWGEGCIAPLFLHAAVPACNIDVLNRDECVEVAVRGVMQMPRVATSFDTPFFASPGAATSTESSRQNSDKRTSAKVKSEAEGQRRRAPPAATSPSSELLSSSSARSTSPAEGVRDGSPQTQTSRSNGSRANTAAATRAGAEAAPPNYSNIANGRQSYAEPTQAMRAAFPGDIVAAEEETGDAFSSSGHESSAIAVHVTYTMDSRPPYRPGNSNDCLNVSLSGTPSVPGSGALPGPLHICLRSSEEVAAWLTFFTFFNPSNTVPLSVAGGAVVFSAAATGTADDGAFNTHSNSDQGAQKEFTAQNGKRSSSPAAKAENDKEKGEGIDDSSGGNAVPSNARGMKTLVQLTPIIFHLPFAGAAAALWDGVQFSAAPAYNALSIPQLEVLVHEELRDGPQRRSATQASPSRLHALHDDGFSVVSLPGTRANHSRGVSAVAGVLLETHQRGPAAADVCRRLVVPAVQVHVRQHASLVQLQSCDTLTALSSILSCRSAQFTLLNAVIQHESQRRGLQYACCLATAGSGNGAFSTHVQAQLQPYLSPPMVMLFQNVCCTYEWQSDLHHDVNAGVTVALHNLRCNDYDAYSRAERQCGACSTTAAGDEAQSPPPFAGSGTSNKTTTHCSTNNNTCATYNDDTISEEPYPLSLTMPFLVEVSTTDAYVWWTSMDPELLAIVRHVNEQPFTASPPPSRVARSTVEETGSNSVNNMNSYINNGNFNDDEWLDDGDRGATRTERRQTSVGTCMPLLLHPVRVRTTIAAASDGGSNSNSKSNRHTRKPATMVAKDERGGGSETYRTGTPLGHWSVAHSQGSHSNRTPHAASTASFHTMPSTSGDSPTVGAGSPPPPPMSTSTPAGADVDGAAPAAAAVAPVFDVSPVHVILSTSAYVMLSEALLHKRHADGAKTAHAAAAGHNTAAAASVASTQKPSQRVYVLMRRALHKPARGAEASLSAVTSSTSSASAEETPEALTLRHEQPQESVHERRCSSENESVNESSSLSRSCKQRKSRAAEREPGTTWRRYCCESASEQVWVEGVELCDPTRLCTQRVGGEGTPTQPAAPLTHDAPDAERPLAQIDTNASESVTFIPLSSVHTADGLLSSVVSTQVANGAFDLDPSKREAGETSNKQLSLEKAAVPAPLGVAVDAAAAEAARRLPASVHVTVIAPAAAPPTPDVPRLLSRVRVTELCLRLVLYQDLESSFTMVGEARDFWQRYTAVHTASRRVAAANDGASLDAATRDPPAPTLLTFLAATVPALRSLLLRSSSAYTPSWSRVSSAVNPGRQRVSPPGPASLLEESGVDALCLQLRGLVVSNFTDARSIVVDGCVCTSVRSPSRPLLAVAQVELYVPTSSVAYPSLAEAARTVAPDLKDDAATAAAAATTTTPTSAAERRRDKAGASSGTGAAFDMSSPTSPQSNAPTFTAAGASQTTTAAFSSAGSAGLSRQDTARTAGADGHMATGDGGTPHPTSPLSHTCTTVEGKATQQGSGRASATAPSKATGDARSGPAWRRRRRRATGSRPVVMMGEVGCRVDSITVDVSATALRAWLSCLVEQPVAALRAAAEEKERWVAFWATRVSQDNGTADPDSATAAAAAPTGGSSGTSSNEAAAGTDTDAAKKPDEALVPELTEPLSLLRWQPGRGLRIYEARDATWSLEHDITLSRNGLVLFFASLQTNLMTVRLNGYSVILDEALLLQPDGLQRTVMVIQSGLTVRFVGPGRVQLPLGLWNPSLWDSKGNTGVEAVLLPFMAIGEGSYLECLNVRLAFSEALREDDKALPAQLPTAVPAALATGAAPSAPLQQSTRVMTPPPPQQQQQPHKQQRRTGVTPAAIAATPLTHRSLHLVLPRVSLIMEPRQESRQVHISTGLELWASACDGVLLRDDLRCTGLAISSESIYDAATTTARTAVLAPVDVRVCSNNGRHHAVSLGTAQVDLGRADLLLLSTYAGELQAVRSYAKYLTHSRVEKEFLELVEETLAWKAAAPVDVLTGEQAASSSTSDSDEEQEDEENDSDGGSDAEDGNTTDKQSPQGNLQSNAAEARTAAAATPTGGGGGGGGGNVGAGQQPAKEQAHSRRGSPDARSVPPSPRDSKVRPRQHGGESPRLGADEPLFALVDGAALPAAHDVRRLDGGQSTTSAAAAAPPASPGPIAALWDSVMSRRSGKGDGGGTPRAAVGSRSGGEPAEEHAAAPPADASTKPQHPTKSETAASSKEQQQQQQQQQERMRRRQRRASRQHARGFSWAVFTPAIELTFSDHRYPLLQLCVQDMLLRRTATSALASTSLARCHKAQVRVYGRGRWDTLLQPSAAVTWSLTQSVSRHSSNRHALLNMEGVHVECSHLIVAKLLYITRQLKTLSTSLQRRLAAAAASVGVTGGNRGLNPAAAADFALMATADGDHTALQLPFNSHVLSVLSGSSHGHSGSSSSSSISSSSHTDDSSTTTDSNNDNKDHHHHRRGSRGADDESSSDSGSRDSEEDAKTDGSAGRKRRAAVHSRRRATAATKEPSAAATDPASSFPTLDPTFPDSLPSSRFTRVEAPGAAGGGGGLAGFAGGAVTVTPSMATHRLLNSFRYTLFAGICEREAVTGGSGAAGVAAAAATTTSPQLVSPGLPSVLLDGQGREAEGGGGSQAAGGSTAEAVPTIWRCKELYRLPPASATDIFISYRRARSLVLTFFPVGCVEWDEDAGVWVLNAKGETDLAAKAVEGTRGFFSAPQPHSPKAKNAEGHAEAERDVVAASNWFPFTTLQYGMARPVGVRTTTRVRAPSRTANNNNKKNSDGIGGSAGTASRASVAAARPRALDLAAGSEYSSYKVQTYALALTCVDPEEEAESLRYPTVVAPGEELEEGRTSSSNNAGSSGGAFGYAAAPSATSRRLSSPLSRRASSGFVDSTAEESAGAGVALHESQRATSGRSIDVVTDSVHHAHGRGHAASQARPRSQASTPVSPAASNGFPTSSTHPQRHQQHQQHQQQHSTSTRHRSRIRNAQPRHHTTTTSGNFPHSAASRLGRQFSSHNTTAAATAAAAAAAAAGVDDGGDGDLLVVRLQARSSLLNETGCTLQLRSLTSTVPSYTSAEEAFSSVAGGVHSNNNSSDGGGGGGFGSTCGGNVADAASSVTVPPGWRLPLQEEDVQNEVLLRVCCPSARWVSTTATTTKAATNTGSASADTLSSDEGEAEADMSNGARASNRPGEAGSSGVFDGASADRWYEARLVLGNLDSGRFLSLSRVRHPSRSRDKNNARGAGRGDASSYVPTSSGAVAGAIASPTVPTAAVADFGAFEDEDRRPLILFVVINYSSDNLIEHISLYPRLTLVNHLGVKVKVAVFQQDPAAGPQTPDEAMLLAPWTAPYVGRKRHERERFHRSLVALGAHDALPHQHALPLHFCTYSSNLVLGLSFSQSTGDTLMTADLDPVITYLREAVDHHPRMLCLHDSHGRTFYVQVSVMPRTVVLSVALWVYNLTEYPLLLCDSVLTRRLSPGQSATTGIIPSQGEPFLIGCRLTDFTQGFFAIGLDGGWSGAVPIDVGSTGVFVSSQSRLGVQRSCNYSILFPNAQEGRPMVLQITPRWVFYNNTQKRLRIYFRFPGLAKAMHEAEKKRRQLQMQQAEASQLSNTTTITSASAKASAAAAATVGAGGTGGAASPKRTQVLRQADDNVSTLTSLATVQLNPGDYHVSCVGPIEGNQFCVQDVLEGVLPSITSITKDNKIEHRDVAAYYESHLTPYMDVDRPGEATFNLWAAPRAPGKRLAVANGGDLIVQRPVYPHPTWLEPYDVYATDAVITGRIAVEVQNTENVLTVLLQPIQGTKILLQNRTARDTVMVRQQGSRRRNRIPPRQNRFFLWEDARQEHRIRVHILGFKGRWFDVDFSAGECQVTYYEDAKAAAEAEALAEAELAHPWPTHIKSDAAPHTPFSFFVRGYANLEKTRVTIVVTESAIPLYASIDSWRTSAVLSLRVSMVQLTWIQEMSAGVAAALSLAAPFGAAAAGADAADDSVTFGGVSDANSNNNKNNNTSGNYSGGEAEGQVIVVDAGEKEPRRDANARSPADGVNSAMRQQQQQQQQQRRRRGRSLSSFAASLSGLMPGRSGGGGGSGPDAFPGSSGSFTANPLLFSIILEGLQMERLSTEDTETFFFAIHQMQWIDEKLGTVFIYRARPRLPPVATSASASEPPSASAGTLSVAGVSPLTSPGANRVRRVHTPVTGSSSANRRPAPTPPSSSTRREYAAMQLPKAAVAATAAAANRVLDTVFGQSDAFLLAMEKANDVEFSYNYIKYADGVTRVTELRYVLTPLVVILTDFWLVDTIQEVRRLRVLLGLRKQAATTQTTTTATVPMMLMSIGPAPQRHETLSPPPLAVPNPSAVAVEAAEGDGAVIPVKITGDGLLSNKSNGSSGEGKLTSSTTSRLTSALSRLASQVHRRTDSEVVIEADNEAAAVPPTTSLPSSVTAALKDSSSSPSNAQQRVSVTERSAQKKKNHPLQEPSQTFTRSPSNSSGSSSSYSGDTCGIGGGGGGGLQPQLRHGSVQSGRSGASSDTETTTVSSLGSTQPRTYAVIRRSRRVISAQPHVSAKKSRTAPERRGHPSGSGSSTTMSESEGKGSDTSTLQKRVSSRADTQQARTPTSPPPPAVAATPPPEAALAVAAAANLRNASAVVASTGVRRTSSATLAVAAQPAASSTAAAVLNSPLTSAARRSRTRRSASQQQRHQGGAYNPTPTTTNTTGFVSQGVFLVQLVHEVRVRLQRQGTGLMAGSLAGVTTSGDSRRHGGTGGRGNALINPLRGVGGLVSSVGGHRRQFVSATVRHHRGAVQRGGAGDGLAGAGTTTATTAASATVSAAGGVAAANAAAGGGGGGGGVGLSDAADAAGMMNGNGFGGAGAGAANAGGDASNPYGNGAVTTTTAAAAAAASSNVNTASFMFIERLEVHRITLYVTFNRHRPDPLRPLLGAYAWMLPSQLNQREFYLPAWTLTQQVETAASLRARLMRWGMHSLREQWTKVTKLGTLLDALQFWQYRTLPLHGAPQTLTLARVQLQRQTCEGRPILFAPCVSSGEDEEAAEKEAEAEEMDDVKNANGRGAAREGVRRSEYEVAPMSPLSPQRK